MSTKTTAATAALAALLLAAAGSVAAQEAGSGHDRGDRPATPDATGHVRAETHAWRSAPAPQPMAPPHAQAAPVAAAPVAPQPPQARLAPVAGANLAPRRDDRNWPGRGRGGDIGPAGAVGPNASPADRADGEDWDELRQARNWGGRNGERFAFAADDQAQPGQPGQPQPQDHRGDRGDHRGDRGPRPGTPPPVTSPDRDHWRGPTPNVTPGPRPATPGPVVGQPQQDHQFRGGDHFDRNRVPPPGGDRDRRDGDHRDWGDRDRDHPPPGVDRDRWREHWREHPEWQRGRFPPVYRTPHRFHVTPYRWPFGYGGRAWGFGEILPPVFWGPSYEILDWWAYDLPAPPPGFTWVRVGYDAVLVDRFDGRIVQVFRGLFWW